MELRDTFPGQREVHVWFVELAAGAASLEECLRHLSADERERASRFRLEAPKTAFTVSRGILRALLGRYLDIEPAGVRLAYGAWGKPRLAFPEAPLAFNLAHSGRFAAYAFAIGCELGIDIEEVRPVPGQESLIRQFFSPEEREEWLELEASERDEAFFRCWTRKEAYIKALGEGLSMPLDGFRVSLRPDEPAALIRADRDPAASSKWSLFSLAPAAGYIAALAVPERALSVRAVPRITAAAVLELVSGPGDFPPAPIPPAPMPSHGPRRALS